MSMQSYSDKIELASQLIQSADYVLIGAGAGLSAAGGLDYNDPELYKKWFPKLASSGLHTIGEAVASNWYMNDDNIRRFWGYWANHISKIRYETPALTPYLQLYELLKDKNHFIISTNVDKQFVKAGFDKKNIFAPQGGYGLFQCRRPCSDEVYQNKSYIDKMISQIDMETFEIREEDIPKCPKCGDYLVKNLRVDDTFVEAPHLVNQDRYLDFVNNSTDGSLVLLELGVGFNTPVIIRWPFEKIASAHPNATLIRMNMSHPEVPQKLIDNSLSFGESIADTLDGIVLKLIFGNQM